VLQLMQSMSLAAAGAQVLVGLGSLVLGILSIGRNRIDDDGSGRPACDQRVDSAAQLFGGRIVARFPAHLSCLAN